MPPKNLEALFAEDCSHFFKGPIIVPIFRSLFFLLYLLCVCLIGAVSSRVRKKQGGHEAISEGETNTWRGGLSLTWRGISELFEPLVMSQGGGFQNCVL